MKKATPAKKKTVKRATRVKKSPTKNKKPVETKTSESLPTLSIAPMAFREEPIAAKRTGPIEFGAGFWIRALAKLLDNAYTYFLGAIAGFMGVIVLFIIQKMGMIDNSWMGQLHGMKWSLLIFSFPAVLLYQIFTEGMYGSSVGKIICRIRVISEDGRSCGLKQALKRNILLFWDALFFGLVGWESMKNTPLRQRYGDVWGKTVVVRMANIPSTSVRSILDFFLGLMAGSFLNVIVMVIGMVIVLGFWQ